MVTPMPARIVVSSGQVRFPGTDRGGQPRVDFTNGPAYRELPELYQLAEPSYFINAVATLYPSNGPAVRYTRASTSRFPFSRTGIAALILLSFTPPRTLTRCRLFVSTNGASPEITASVWPTATAQRPHPCRRTWCSANTYPGGRGSYVPHSGISTVWGQPRQ